MTVNLSSDGGIFSSWNCLEGENTFSWQLHLSAEETKKSLILPLMPEGQGYVYKSQFSPSGNNILLMGDKFLCEISREDGRLIRTPMKVAAMLQILNCRKSASCFCR